MSIILSPLHQRQAEEMNRVAELVRERQGKVLVVHSSQRYNVRSGCMGSDADHYHQVEAGVIDGEAFTFDLSGDNTLGLSRYFVGVPLTVPVRNRKVIGDVHSNPDMLPPFELPVFRLDQMRGGTDNDGGIRLGGYFYGDSRRGFSLNYYIGDGDIMARFGLLINGSKRSRQDFIDFIKQG